MNGRKSGRRGRRVRHRGRGRGGNGRQGPKRPHLITSYNSVRTGHIVNSEVIAKLEYVQQYSLVSATTPYAARYVYTNCAYDVDPALGSTNTTGFAEYAAFYNYYRVIQYDYVIEVVNGAAVPVIFTVGNTVTPLGLGSGVNTSVDLHPYTGNQYFQSILLGSVNGDGSRHVFRGKHTISQIVGSSAPETEDNYRSLVTTTPVDLSYLLYGASGIAGASLTTAVAVKMRIGMVIRFYDRKPIET